MGELWYRELRQSKAHPRLPNASNYKVLLYLPPFCRISNIKCWPSPLDVENCTYRNIGPTYLFDFHTHHRNILYHVATIYNTTDRQADRESPRNRPLMQWHRHPKTKRRNGHFYRVFLDVLWKIFNFIPQLTYAVKRTFQETDKKSNQYGPNSTTCLTLDQL